MSRLSLDRATSTKKVTPLSIVGLILVPLLLGAILVWGLWNPASRLPQMTGAIVNLDEPAEIDGQVAPLGRLLAGELVDSKVDENFTWKITNEEDAEAGLDDGSYATVVTIPKSFSTAATSFSGDAADATQATIDIQTSPKSKLVDSALSSTVTSTATRLLGQQLTKTYVENLYVGFNTLGDQLGEAADGATQLADGSVQLGDGATQLATGTSELSTGLGTLSSGAAQLSGGVAQLSTGANALSTGAAGLAGGAATLSSGMNEFAAGLAGSGAQLPALTGGATLLGEGAATAASLATQAAGTSQSTVDALNLAIAQCTATSCDPSVSAILTGALQAATGTQQLNSGISQATAGVNAGLNGVPGDPANPGLVAGVAGLADGVTTASGAANQLAAGATELSGGAQQLATGAGELATGVGTLATGASGLATGASSAHEGSVALSSGAGELATGVGTLTNGVKDLGSGLTQASTSLPKTTESERANLSGVVADPVTSGKTDTGLFDASGIPFFATLALWVGGLVSFLLLRPIPRRAMTAAQSSLRIATTGMVPGLVIGALQGLLVAGIMQVALTLDLGAWFGFAGLSMLAGAAFGAVNQGLAAVFGGVGRFISMIITVLSLAAGIVSTVPPIYETVLSALPLTTAIEGMRAIDAGTAGAGSSVMGLIAWLLFGFVLTLLAVLRERSVKVSSLRVPQLSRYRVAATS